MTVNSINYQNTNHLSKQDYIDKEKSKANRWVLPSAAMITIAEVATELIEKENRKDSFVKTAKSCAKSHTNLYKKIIAWVTEKITKCNKYTDKIMNFSNKKAFAGIMAFELGVNYLFMKWCNNWGVERKANKLYQQ